MKTFIKIIFSVLFIFISIYLCGCSATIYTKKITTLPSSYYFELKNKLIEATVGICVLKIGDELYNVDGIKVSKTNIEISAKKGNSTTTFKYLYSDLSISNLEYREWVNEELEELYPCAVNFIDLNYHRFYWGFENSEYASQFLDALIFLKYKKYYQINITEELNKFEDIAKQYRDLNTKPDLPEEARKYIVQATSSTKDKNYAEAIKLYNKAIEIDQTYPEARFNLALLFGLVEEYEFAICEMKKYLMLVPDAKDSRAAQDKIYEWEGKIE